jgi:hypothetical protein
MAREKNSSDERARERQKHRETPPDAGKARVMRSGTKVVKSDFQILAEENPDDDAKIVAHQHERTLKKRKDLVESNRHHLFALNPGARGVKLVGRLCMGGQSLHWIQALAVSKIVGRLCTGGQSLRWIRALSVPKSSGDCAWVGGGSLGSLALVSF